MPELPSGTVTFLFTDIEGSTRLLQQLRGRYAPLLADHHRLLRAAFEEWGGYELQSQGDAFVVAFPRARDATLAAVAAQRALAEHAWPDGLEFRVRMGLHTGEPSLSEAGLVSLAVHRAARISAAGHGGQQVLLSSTTRDLVEDDLPDDVRVRELGEHRLKDLDRPERLFQLEIEGLPAEFPPVRAVDDQRERAARRIERQGQGAGTSRPSTGWRFSRRSALVIASAVAVLAAVAVTVAVVIGRGQSGPKPLSKDAYQNQLLDAYRPTNATVLKRIGKPPNTSPAVRARLQPLPRSPEYAGRWTGFCAPCGR